MYLWLSIVVVALVLVPVFGYDPVQRILSRIRLSPGAINPNNEDEKL